jgi:hypothetical protein
MIVEYSLMRRLRRLLFRVDLGRKKELEWSGYEILNSYLFLLYSSQVLYSLPLRMLAHRADLRFLNTDTVNILTARFETLPLTSPSLDKPALVALFRALASLVYVTFQSQIGTHVDEMGYLVAKFWPIWLGLVESNQGRSGS